MNSGGISIERASKSRVGSKNEWWEIKNEICDEKMKNEDEEESMEYESRKFMEASNVNENVTKWKSTFHFPVRVSLSRKNDGGKFKFEQETMEIFKK